MIRLSAPLRPIAAVVSHLFALWVRSWRVEVLRPDGSLVPLRDHAVAPAVYALSERDLLAVTAVARVTSAMVLVAPGNDGDWAVALARPLGCRFVRGSSLREGMAGLRQLVEALRANDAAQALIAVDGPLGPAGQVREGVVHCAAWSGRPVVPVAAAARRAIVFRGSWAQHYLPLPFTRVVFAAGVPLPVTRPLGRASTKAQAEAIASEMKRLRTCAEVIVTRAANASASVRHTA